MTQPAKQFNDAHKYEQEIERLVPGYSLLHSMIPSVLRSLAPAAKRVLVVGCGPGDELVRIASTVPGARVDAVEPAAAMADAARRRLLSEGLSARVHVHTCTVAELQTAEPYDLVVALLVGHFIPDDGAREAFMRSIGDAVSPQGLVLLAEIEHVGDAHEILTAAHLQYARASGLPEERLRIMRERLDGGFHTLSRDRFHVLAAAADLEVATEFFRAFGTVAWILRGASRQPTQSP